MAAAAACPTKLLDSWVQCERCSKWRRLPAADEDTLDEMALDDDWYCEQNPDVQRADCSVPEEVVPAAVEPEGGETAGTLDARFDMGDPGWMQHLDDQVAPLCSSR